MDRADVVFESEGIACAGYVYRPDDVAGPIPCVVMAHGFSGTRDLGLLAYAERFVAAGMAVLVFDYAYFGASGGRPRQLIAIRQQLADCRAAVRFARALDGIDANRIALWGTSLGGGHVVEVAADDPRIAAVVSQVPFAGIEFGRRTSQRSSTVTLRLFGAAIEDAIRGLFGYAPRLIRVFGEPGEVAIFSDEHDTATMKVLAAQAPTWRNEVAARVLIPLLRYRPGLAAARMTQPLLTCVAERDTAGSPALAIQMAQRAPHGELRTYPFGHFDVYVSAGFEAVIEDEIEFLRKQVGSP